MRPVDLLRSRPWVPKNGRPGSLVLMLAFAAACEGELTIAGGDDAAVPPTEDGGPARMDARAPDAGASRPPVGQPPDAGGGRDAGGFPAACLAIPDDPETYRSAAGRFLPANDGPCRYGEAGLEGACGARCDVATVLALLACDGVECREQAIAGDPTPPIQATDQGERYPVDCDECLYAQNVGCQQLVCPVELDAVFDCLDTLNDPDDFDARCGDLDAALYDCLFGPHSAFGLCTDVRVDLWCFGRSLPEGAL